MNAAQWLCHVTRSKVKVVKPELEIFPFLQLISSAIYNSSWQMISE